MGKTFEFTEELVNEILQFLGDQKYTAVAPLINKIAAAIAMAEKTEGEQVN